MTYNEIVQKLIGDIHPCGQNHIDEKRFENLEHTIALAENLIQRIALIAPCKDLPEHSMSKAGKLAQEFIDGLKEIE